MKNLSYIVNDIKGLKSYIASPEVQGYAGTSKAILVQVFSSQTHQNELQSITEAISAKLPTAIIAGSTTVGEIAEGKLLIGTTVLSFSFFDETMVTPIAVNCAGLNETEIGQNLLHSINKLGPDVAGVLLFATPQSIDLAKLFKGMSAEAFSFPFFGGGAGVYDSTETSMVFCEKEYFRQGVIAIVFLSRELHIYSKTYLGWRPLSKEMTITESEGMLVKKIDGVPAFDIYNRYLNIQNDKDFFSNVLEFPLLLKRDGDIIARVPFSVDENGVIDFFADLEVGEKFHIGYGDPDTIVENSILIQNEMSDFKPDAIFLYTCICRRFLMQNDVNLETRPFEHIAPTAGFYTYGEFYSHENKIQLLNSTMVVVGMREGEKENRRVPRNVDVNEKGPNSVEIDPYADKHNRIVSKLLHFIGVVTSELEEANKELARISGIDKLTQIYNRLKLDDILQQELSRSERYGEELAVILMDLDFFKKVNDTYGHLAGDDVLVRTADIIKDNIRKVDAAGRWGGEEFLAVLPETGLEQACCVAEKLRVAIGSENFPGVGHVSCSFGVTTYYKNDDQDKLLRRADKALYQAKDSGRNRVSFIDPNKS